MSWCTLHLCTGRVARGPGRAAYYRPAQRGPTWPKVPKHLFYLGTICIRYSRLSSRVRGQRWRWNTRRNWWRNKVPADESTDYTAWDQWQRSRLVAHKLKFTYTRLSIVAKAILSIPASSAASERSFSVATQIACQRWINADKSFSNDCRYPTLFQCWYSV